MTRPLVLLTSKFPYGHASEPFLESEIEVLARRFPRVYVLPSNREPTVRDLPDGAELIEMEWLTPASKRTRELALASREAAATVRATLNTWAAATRYFHGGRAFADLLAQNVLKARLLRRFVESMRLQDALFYDYWYENSTLALALVRRSGLIRRAVARTHNFDLYDDHWEAGEVPFRRAKALGLDAIFAVSQSGARYLAERLPEARRKITVQRLGVRDPGAACPPPEGEAPLIMTCALLRPEKRIHLVPDVLAELHRPVRWVHFGDGPEHSRVAEAASRMPSRVTWQLMGQVPNGEVLQFYERHNVAALLSVSLSEGLPVSMMEAQSYGVPVVACDVGGVAELVNQETGVLVANDTSPAQITAALDRALTPNRFSPSSVRAFFKEHFDADDNYNRFADALIRLG